MGFTFNLISQFAELMLKTNMNHGKNICRQLKQLRRDIADANGIELHQKECTYQGECEGTCPYCDAELRYLERELDRRRNIGKAAIVAGTVLTMASVQTAQAQEPVVMGKPAMPVEEAASQGTLKGTVTDRKTGEPMIGCNVVLRQNGQIITGARTDFDGIYTIKGVKAGTYSVEFSYIGYIKLIVPDFEVRAEGFTILNQKMSSDKNAKIDAVVVEGPLMGIVPVTEINIGEPDTGRTPTVIIETNSTGEATGRYAIGGVEVQLNGTPASAPAEPSPAGRKVDDDNTNPLDNCVR